MRLFLLSRTAFYRKAPQSSDTAINECSRCGGVLTVAPAGLHVSHPPPYDNFNGQMWCGTIHGFSAIVSEAALPLKKISSCDMHRSKKLKNGHSHFNSLPETKKFNFTR